MWKILGGVVVGYLAMVVWVMLTFTGLWMVLGQEAAFEPGTSRVTGAWLAGSLPLAFLGAILGGWVAARIGGVQREKAVWGLVGLVLVLGYLEAIMKLGADPGALPAGDLGPFEAAAHAVQPGWYLWTIPLFGALGVWLGGRAGRRDEAPASEPAA
jgi:hypothetical protein